MNNDQHIEKRNFLVDIIKAIFKPLFDGYLPSFLPMTDSVKQSMHKFSKNKPDPSNKD